MAEVQEKATKKWQKLQAKRVSAQLATEELFAEAQCEGGERGGAFSRSAEGETSPLHL